MEMSIVTKTGDSGTTGLYGGRRVSKDHVRLQAYGTVDELNAAVGVALAQPVSDALQQQLLHVQHLLFRAGADLATPADSAAKTQRVRPVDTAEIEGWITQLEASLSPQTTFILPGGSPLAAHLHVCRTICRRAERWVVSLCLHEQIPEEVRVFLNRLSDYFFLAARQANVEAGVGDVGVRYE
jgi:cob(I)alamin adenosyltransferase